MGLLQLLGHLWCFLEGMTSFSTKKATSEMFSVVLHLGDSVLLLQHHATSTWEGVARNGGEKFPLILVCGLPQLVERFHPLLFQFPSTQLRHGGMFERH